MHEVIDRWLAERKKATSTPAPDYLDPYKMDADYNEYLNCTADSFENATRRCKAVFNSLAQTARPSMTGWPSGPGVWQLRG